MNYIFLILLFTSYIFSNNPIVFNLDHKYYEVISVVVNSVNKEKEFIYFYENNWPYDEHCLNILRKNHLSLLKKSGYTDEFLQAIKKLLNIKLKFQNKFMFNFEYKMVSKDFTPEIGYIFGNKKLFEYEIYQATIPVFVHDYAFVIINIYAEKDKSYFVGYYLLKLTNGEWKIIKRYELAA